MATRKSAIIQPSLNCSSPQNSGTGAFLEVVGFRPPDEVLYSDEVAASVAPREVSLALQLYNHADWDFSLNS